MKKIQTDRAPKVVGPYSQGILAGNFVFCAGQIGIDPQTGELVEGIESQTRQVISNLREVLKATGMDLNAVVKTEVYLKNMSDYNAMNETYEKEFNTDPKPARVTVAAAELPRNALVEISAAAYKE